MSGVFGKLKIYLNSDSYSKFETLYNEYKSRGYYNFLFFIT